MRYGDDPCAFLTRINAPPAKPNLDMSPANPVPSEMRLALQSLHPFVKQAMGFSVCASLLVLTPSLYMLEVYGRVLNSRNHLTLLMLTVMVVGAYVMMEVLEWVRSEILLNASVALDNTLQTRVFHATFDAKLKRLSEGGTQPLSDLRNLCSFLYAPVVAAVMDAPVALLFALLLFAISPWLGICSVLAALMQTGLGWLNERKTHPQLMLANRSSSATQQYAHMLMRNALLIHAMGMLSHTRARWSEKQNTFLKQQSDASNAAGYYQAVSKFLQNSVGSLLLGLGAWLFLHNQINGGAASIVVASILGGRVLSPLVLVVSQWPSVLQARSAFDRLERLLSAIPQRPPGMKLPPPKGHLNVEEVWASAPGSTQPILQAVGFDLQPGDVLAVVGPSASGKSTLARLLVGVWPASKGKVRLDGIDVASWDPSERGPSVGYLPQGVELIEGTVAQNIARFGAIDNPNVEQAARAVGLHDAILELPQGYDTPVGTDGSVLSGGQRQRLGLARAVYGNPSLLVLDEPNASLDQEGDAALAQTLRQMSSQGCCCVVMTHRTSVLAVANKLLVLRDGRRQLFGERNHILQILADAARSQTAPSNTQTQHEPH